MATATFITTVLRPGRSRSEKLALKRLTASDLTFFEWHFRNRNAGNQKAINLNADIFAKRLYPAVEVVARQSQNKLGIDLWIAGPGAAPPHNYQRKIIKGAAYKNWRLDGEMIYDPEADPGRFKTLRAGDLALLGFDGDLAPNTLHLVLVSKSAPEDGELLARLDELLADRRMAELERGLSRFLLNFVDGVSRCSDVTRLFLVGQDGERLVRAPV